MPNWTTNIVAMRAEDMDKVLNAEGNFDFNLIRPMPESLNICEGSDADAAVKAAEARRRGDREAFDAAVAEARLPWRKPPFATGMTFMECETPDQLADVGEVYIGNVEKYGARSWYDWCCDNWNTKWNACETHVEEHGPYKAAEFLTAWACPSLEMLKELAVRNGSPVWIEWADEDFDGVKCALLSPSGKGYGFGGQLAMSLHAVTVSDGDGEEWESFTNGEISEEKIAQCLGLARVLERKTA